MKVLKDKLPNTNLDVYRVENAPFDGADGGNSEWYFRFRYASGSTHIHAWAYLAGHDDAVELIVDERNGLQGRIADHFERISRNVFSQAKFVRTQLPYAIREYRRAAVLVVSQELPPLADRISIVNAEFDFDEAIHILFDIAVDGEIVERTLEWLDDDLDLVRQDCHLDVNSCYRESVANALGADKGRYDDISDDARSGVLGDIADVVHKRLVATHAALKSKQVEEMGLEDWWHITPSSGDGLYGYGSAAEAHEYAELLDEQDGREFDCHCASPVSIATAFGVHHYGFVLSEALSTLREGA